MEKFNIFFITLLSLIAFGGVCNGGDLVNNFYSTSCPEAEHIVRHITWFYVAINPALPAHLLRLHFHDCFVRGCDGSILIESTPSNTAEKDAEPSRSLSGFDVIDKIKTRLETACPGIVSCADIVALAARDSVSFQFHRSMWEVLTGRRDGTVSLASEAVAEIPLPSFKFISLTQSFASKGLSVKDLVVLSGAHTIGVAHCDSFSNRLYNFTGIGDADPSLNPIYAAILRLRCRRLSDNTTTVEMDPGSSLIFGNRYYLNLRLEQGLFQSDAALLTDSIANGIVDEMMLSPRKFYTEFGESMKRMGAIGVLTGNEGEIRKKCSMIN